MKSEFFIELKHFEDEIDKATDWLIKSWKLQEEDREIALLYRKKHKKQALIHLTNANLCLK